MKSNAMATALNLVTLLVGFGMGALLRPNIDQAVHAQTTDSVRTQVIEPIFPGVTTGTFGARIVLAHEIQSDSLVVNGYDLLQIHQNTLNYLANQIGANKAVLQSIVDNSKAAKLYTIKPPSPSPPQTKPEEKKP